MDVLILYHEAIDVCEILGKQLKMYIELVLRLVKFTAIDCFCYTLSPDGQLKDVQMFLNPFVVLCGQCLVLCYRVLYNRFMLCFVIL